MSNAFINKLIGFAPLTAEDVKSLREACAVQRDYPARVDLIREGDEPGPLLCILDGWACRYNILPEGTRQISAFLMPGDCCDMYAAVLDAMDHSIATLAPARVALIPRARIQELMDGSPTITRALWWTQLVHEGTLRAWIVSMGRRDSVQRVAHLMCELYLRGRNIGLAPAGRFELPLTQVVLGDALGLTPVHINRVLRKLRLAGTMELSGGMLTIADPAELARVAGFDDNYLHRKVKRAA